MTDTTLRGAIIAVMTREGSAMHYRAITEGITAEDLGRSETAATPSDVNGVITTSLDTEGKDSPFERVGGEYYALRGQATESADREEYLPDLEPIYVCEMCGMSVGTITCGRCGKELTQETATTEDYRTINVSVCPDGHGMVKSPVCCGQDMVCLVD
ncbi:MAG: HTH domain-containing protein [Gemmatimonadota bacterium]|nr:HTH domain-containing protein [Gemmatimonadota bacterium]|tara:strand:- start:355 stop:825 length:471 start_codon:yes stop_codon:yes gene_type:complete